MLRFALGLSLVFGVSCIVGCTPKPEVYITRHAVSGATYYVDATHPSACDCNLGTSPDAPWKTISHANAVLQAGDAVFIKPGEYRDRIDPTNSGTVDAPIIYAGYGIGWPIIKSVLGENQYSRQDTCGSVATDHIIIDHVACDAGYRELYGWFWIDGNHVRIEEGHFFGLPSNRGVQIDGSYNKIVRNRMEPNPAIFTVCPSWGCFETIAIDDGYDYNLIDGNVIADGGHNALSIESSYNIIRNNTLSNPYYRILSILSVEGTPHHNVFDNNNFEDSGNLRGTQVLQNWGAKNIFRRNRVYRNGGNGYKLTRPNDGENAEFIDHNKIYNNVFYGNGAVPASEGEGFDLWVRAFGENSEDTVLVNNVFYRNNVDSAQQIQIRMFDGGWNGTQIRNNCVRNEVYGEDVINVTGSGTSYGPLSLSSYQLFHPANMSGNIDCDPGFKDPDQEDPDFSLEPTSGLIDRGDFLTRTIRPTGGPSHWIRVEDAGYFISGYGLVPGDTIEFEDVGSGKQTTTITDVYYGINLLVVEPAVDLEADQGVALPYNGAAPDIGAHEY